MILPNENRKNEQQDHRILQVRISLSTKFQLKLKNLIFWTKFSQQGCFRSKTKRVNATIAFCIFKLLWVPDFTLTNNFKFWDQIFLKNVFPVKNKISEHLNWILHIQIRLYTKFHCKLTTFNFETKFAQKEYFWSKKEKLNITIDLYIFEII